MRVSRLLLGAHRMDDKQDNYRHIDAGPGRDRHRHRCGLGKDFYVAEEHVVSDDHRHHA
jgi:hypothetical protein